MPVEAFYRAINMAENFGLIQGGATIMKPGQKLIPPIAHEPTTLTGLSHQTGTISMARGALGTARSDFFITVGDMSSLDAHPDKPGDNQGFAAFGRGRETGLLAGCFGDIGLADLLRSFGVAGQAGQ